MEYKCKIEAFLQCKYLCMFTLWDKMYSSPYTTPKTRVRQLINWRKCIYKICFFSHRKYCIDIISINHPLILFSSITVRHSSITILQSYYLALRFIAFVMTVTDVLFSITILIFQLTKILLLKQNFVTI